MNKITHWTHSRNETFGTADAKHVLVVGSDADVRAYLRAQSVPKAALHAKGELMVEGIQFHADGQKLLSKYINESGASQEDETSKLPKLDAIVLTTQALDSLQNEGMIHQLEQIKVIFPDVKILIDGFSPKSCIHVDHPNADWIAKNSFAIPAVELGHKRPELTITRDTQNFWLAPPIDRMCVNSRDKARDLRDMLGIKPLQPSLPGH